MSRTYMDVNLFLGSGPHTWDEWQEALADGIADVKDRFPEMVMSADNRAALSWLVVQAESLLSLAADRIHADNERAKTVAAVMSAEFGPAVIHTATHDPSGTITVTVTNPDALRYDSDRWYYLRKMCEDPNFLPTRLNASCTKRSNE